MDLREYSGAAPGFEGGAKAVVEMVSYKAGVTVNARQPSPPPPWVCLDGYGITIDPIKNLGNILVGGGSDDQGNDWVWERFHNFPA